MPTIRNSEDRSAIRERLASITPTQSRKWGVMSIHPMLCHLADQMRVALGEIPVHSKPNLAGQTLLRFLVIHTGVKPPPGKIKTAPEMLTTKPGQWDADLATCHRLVEQIATADRLHPHPFFGNLSVDEWGKLTWKHLDHHLRQFGA